MDDVKQEAQQCAPQALPPGEQQEIVFGRISVWDTYTSINQ